MARNTPVPKNKVASAGGRSASVARRTPVQQRALNNARRKQREIKAQNTQNAMNMRILEQQMAVMGRQGLDNQRRTNQLFLNVANGVIKNLQNAVNFYTTQGANNSRVNANRRLKNMMKLRVESRERARRYNAAMAAARK